MITTINEFKLFLNEGKRSDKQYKKEVALYKYFIVNTKTNKVESGWEFKDDAKDELKNYDGDKDFKIMSEIQLKKAGIENPKQKWINESLDMNSFRDLNKHEQARELEKHFQNKNYNVYISAAPVGFNIEGPDKSDIEIVYRKCIELGIDQDKLYKRLEE